jgi:hypothetical protein
MADAFLADLPASNDVEDLLHLLRSGASHATKPRHLLDMLGVVRIERQAGPGPVASVDFALPEGFPAFRLLGWVDSSVDASIAMRLSADGGATWRTANYQYAANIFNTSSGSQVTHYAGFNISDESAFWLYINPQAGHPNCLDLTLTAPRDTSRKTMWNYALMQHHTSETGRGGFGGGLYIGDEAHDTVQILMLGGAADVVDFDLTLYGVH